MSLTPEISVVMGVYNGATGLRDSIQSVLTQESVDLELIIVDDGSTDESDKIIASCASSDGRVRVIRQRHAGLTRALIRGCVAAGGTYIARQDAGDLSLPGRLRSEVEVLRRVADTALVSCGTRFVGPAGEPLYENVPVERDGTAALLTESLRNVSGPSHHGSVLFRRDLYERVGGYRPEFYYAQDLDLWVRLADKGSHIQLPDVLYQAKFTPVSISGAHRERQVALARIILECARLRRAGADESDALARAARIGPGLAKPGVRDRAQCLYFLGSCLQKKSDPRARQYFIEALKAYPFHVKSLARLIGGALK